MRLTSQWTRELENIQRCGSIFELGGGGGGLIPVQ